MTKPSIKILAIEDDRLIRRLMRATLAPRGFATIEAQSGATALKALREKRPDLIILDLGLPDIDGLDLLREICDISNVPVVVLSNTTSVTLKVAHSSLAPATSLQSRSISTSSPRDFV